MKRLMISGFAAIALLATGSLMLRSHSPSAARATGAAERMSSQGVHAAPDVNKLPIEDFDDMSLVYSTGTKR